MKKSVFPIVLIMFSFLQLSTQESVKILLNDNERFRFVNDRLKFINPNNNVLLGDCAGVDNYSPRNVFLWYKAGLSNTGDVTWDDDYIYVKTTAGWKKSALSTW